MSWNNLDLKCATAAAGIRDNLEKTREKDLEKTIGACSSILSRHGPYALFLYLRAEAEKKHRPGQVQAPKNAASYIRL